MEKNLVCNLQYGPKTRLIRGIYFWMVNTQSYKYLWFFYSNLCFGFIKWLVLVDGTFQTFFSLFSFHFRALPSRSFIIPPQRLSRRSPGLWWTIHFRSRERFTVCKLSTRGDKCNSSFSNLSWTIQKNRNCWALRIAKITRKRATIVTITHSDSMREW